MISEQYKWDIIENNFKNNGFVKHQVDTFIHSWDECRAIDLYNPKKLEINSDKQALDILIPMLDLNGIKIEGNTKNNVLMYYSIKKCFDLIEEEPVPWLHFQA